MDIGEVPITQRIRTQPLLQTRRKVAVSRTMRMLRPLAPVVGIGEAPRRKLSPRPLYFIRVLIFVRETTSTFPTTARCFATISASPAGVGKNASNVLLRNGQTPLIFGTFGPHLGNAFLISRYRTLGRSVLSNSFFNALLVHALQHPGRRCGFVGLEIARRA